MSVNLSPIAGVAGQLFDNNGDPLTGGKVFTYAAGTTTNQTTYVNSLGTTPHSNPIILDAAGRVPGGEIWLTDGSSYKFVITDSTNVLIGTYDNISGINSNFVNFVNEQEIQTATAGQTVFNLATTNYQPGTNSLSVFVDGVNQYGPGAQYAYLETDSDTVTFVTGLHVGAEVKFTTSQINSSSATSADQISYQPAGAGAVNTTVQAKLRETVSVKDFGAVGDGVTDDTAAIQAAIDYAFAQKIDLIGDGATYGISAKLIIPTNSPAPTFELANKITMDFRNSKFKMLADATLFETSNFGSALDSDYSIGITLTNFGVESNVGQLTLPTLKIQDWHQQCQVTNITSAVSQQMLWSKNCYYMTIDNIQSTLIAPKAGDRFIWFDNTNLCKISRLVAANANTGYRFDGPVTATVLESMSFEGQTIGVAFNATVYDIAIRDSYFESWSDVAIVFNDYVENAVIDNNYFNFLNDPTAYLLYYEPLPGGGVNLTSSNNFTAMPSQANLIKNREDLYGTQIQINLPNAAASSINDFLVDNTVFGRRIDLRQRKRAVNYFGNVVNEYAVGNYAGKFTDGFSNSNGFEWVDLSSTSLRLRTRIIQNFVQLVYVNIEVAFSGGGPTYIAGLFIGNQFYKADSSAGLVNSTDLTGATDANGFFQIDGGFFFAGNLTGVKGEIRLI